MKCRYCGYDMPEGELICERCGREIFAVPDYNPLDDMLTAQIKVGINDEDDELQENLDQRNINTDRIAGEPSARGRNLSGRDTGERSVGGRNSFGRGPAERESSVRNTPGRNTAGNSSAGNTSGRNTSARNTGRNTSARNTSGRNTGRNTSARNTAGNTSGRNTSARNTYTRNTSARNVSSRNTSAGGTVSEREKRRRQAEKKKAALRKKRRMLLIGIAVIILIAAAGFIFAYQNSYNGIVRKGYKELENHEYDNAALSFQRAITKNDKKPDAYTGLSKVYIEQDKIEEGTELFDGVIEKQPENVDIYEAYIGFLLDTRQQMSIPVLLDDAKDSVKYELDHYITGKPEYSLDDTKVFEDVQQIELSAGKNTVYYTTDGSEPDMSSTKYTEPIQLSEGETTIKAIAVDKRGIPSLPEEKTYVVEFPVVDAPAVSPSTGQYEASEPIEVIVPDGYEAYYTMNGEDPTTASTKYTGPIDMPEGETLFKVLLANKSGRTSAVTTRNYMLETEE